MRKFESLLLHVYISRHKLSKYYLIGYHLAKSPVNVTIDTQVLFLSDVVVNAFHSSSITIRL